MGRHVDRNEKYSPVMMPSGILGKRNTVGSDTGALRLEPQATLVWPVPLRYVEQCGGGMSLSPCSHNELFPRFFP